VIFKIIRTVDKYNKVTHDTTHKIVRLETCLLTEFYACTYKCMYYFTALYQLQRKLEATVVTEDD
jgi:hypothetical protein